MFAQRYKLLLIAACLALMGPSIVLYLPIWWAGVLLHQHKDRIKLHRAVALTGSIVSVIAFAVISVESNTELLYQASMQITPVVLKHFLLEPAGYFMVDFLLAMMVVIHLLCVYHLTASAQSKFQKNWMSKNIQWLSTHTFSLYLFHMPILFFISAVLPATQSPTLNAFCILIATPISIGIMSMWIEANKHKLKAFFTSLIAH